MVRQPAISVVIRTSALPARRSLPKGRRTGPVAALIASASLIAGPIVSVGATGDVGYEDQSFSGTSEPTGTKRAESVLFWNDGSWWANMWDTASKDFHIFRLDLPSQAWIDTGVTTDGRANSRADVLWDGSRLYIASHLAVNDEHSAVAGYPSYLYRFSYDSVTDRYSLDSGFPVQINNHKTKTLVIDKDSTGQLWATWQQDNQIYVNRTLNGDDRQWGTPFVLPAAGASVAVDDISAVVAIGGDRIGVMWSNESADAMYFAVHHDSDDDTTWEASRTAIQGPREADDHISLKSIQADGSGRVYAAVKTSLTSSAAPLIMLLVRDPATGNWSSHPIARVSDCPNRPMIVIDEENEVVHAFYTAPAPPPHDSCNSSGGAIYEKTSVLESISFPVGDGTPVIVDADSPYVHNASSTKQTVTSQTGMVVLARNSRTVRYWHHYVAIPPGSGGGGDTTAPVAPSSLTATAGDGQVILDWTDNAEPDLAGYNVYRSPASGGGYGKLNGGLVGSSAYTDTTVNNGTTYYYVVTAVDSSGNESASSGETSAKPSASGPPSPSTIERQAVSTTVNVKPTSSIVVATPAGTAEGDFLVACLALNGGNVSAAPAGWTTIATVNQIRNPRVFGYYRVASATEAASHQWTLTSSVANGAGIARYSGVSVSSPLGSNVTTATGSSATSATIPDVTTEAANAMLIGCVGVNSSATSMLIEAPAGMTQVWDIGGKRHELAEGPQATAGAGGSKTWTFSGKREWAGWLVALRPA